MLNSELILVVWFFLLNLYIDGTLRSGRLVRKRVGAVFKHEK